MIADGQKVTRAETVITGEGEEVEGKNHTTYDMQIAEEVFKWIDQSYRRRFSIKVTWTVALKVFMDADKYAHAALYDFVHRNCADAVAYGLMQNGIYTFSCKVFGITIPNIQYEQLRCVLIEVCTGYNMSPAGHEYNPWVDP